MGRDPIVLCRQKFSLLQQGRLNQFGSTCYLLPSE
jgi:hypothetical protein